MPDEDPFLQELRGKAPKAQVEEDPFLAELRGATPSAPAPVAPAQAPAAPVQPPAAAPVVVPPSGRFFSTNPDDIGNVAPPMPRRAFPGAPMPEISEPGSPTALRSQPSGDPIYPFDKFLAENVGLPPEEYARRGLAAQLTVGQTAPGMPVRRMADAYSGAAQGSVDLIESGINAIPEAGRSGRVGDAFRVVADPVRGALGAAFSPAMGVAQGGVETLAGGAMPTPGQFGPRLTEDPVGALRHAMAQLAGSPLTALAVAGEAVSEVTGMAPEDSQRAVDVLGMALPFGKPMARGAGRLIGRGSGLVDAALTKRAPTPEAIPRVAEVRPAPEPAPRPAVPRELQPPIGRPAPEAPGMAFADEALMAAAEDRAPARPATLGARSPRPAEAPPVAAAPEPAPPPPAPVPPPARPVAPPEAPVAAEAPPRAVPEPVAPVAPPPVPAPAPAPAAPTGPTLGAKVKVQKRGAEPYRSTGPLSQTRRVQPLNGSDRLLLQEQRPNDSTWWKVKETRDPAEAHRWEAAEPALAPAKPAPPVAEAPAPPKTVRLYRVEPEDPAAVQEWNRKHAIGGDQGGPNAGRYFSDDVEALRPYGHENGGVTYYVDVPSDVANSLRRRHESGFNEYVLPDEYVSKKRPVAPEAPAPRPAPAPAPEAVRAAEPVQPPATAVPEAPRPTLRARAAEPVEKAPATVVAENVESPAERSAVIEASRSAREAEVVRLGLTEEMIDRVSDGKGTPREKAAILDAVADVHGYRVEGDAQPGTAMYDTVASALAKGGEQAINVHLVDVEFKAQAAARAKFRAPAPEPAKPTLGARATEPAPEVAAPASTPAKVEAPAAKIPATVEFLRDEAKNGAWGTAKRMYDQFSAKELAEVHTATRASGWKGVKEWLVANRGDEATLAAEVAKRREVREAQKAAAKAAPKAEPAAPARTTVKPMSPKAQAAFDDALAKTRAGDVDGAETALRRVMQNDRATANEIIDAVPIPTEAQIAKLPEDMRSAARSPGALARVHAHLRGQADAEAGMAPEAKPKVKVKVRGPARRPGGRSGERGEVAVPDLEGIYDRLDNMAGRAVRATGRGALKVPGARVVKATAQTLYERGFTSDAQRIGPEFSQRTHQRRGQRNLAKNDAGTAAVRVDEMTERLPDADRAALDSYMKSETDTLPASIAAHKDAIDAVSAEIKALGQEEVARGMRKQETVDQYPRYLPRQYASKMTARKFLTIGDRPRVQRNFIREDAPGVFLNAKEYLPDVEAIGKKHGAYAPSREGNTVALKFKTPEAREAFRAEIRDTFGGAKRRLDANATESIRGGEVREAKGFLKAKADTPGKRDIITGRFDPLPAELRESLGEIKDPTTNTHDAILRAKQRIADFDFMKGLDGGADAKGDWVSATEQAGYTKMTERWALPLREKWVRNDVYEWLKGEVGPRDTPGFARGWLDQWKANKTVWSPRTAVRQFFGNPMFMKLAGVDPTNPANWPAMKKAVQSLRSDSPLRTELIEQNVLGPHDFASLELERGEGVGSNPAYNWGKALANPIAATKVGKAAQRKFGRFYGTSDAFTRASIYWRYRERGFEPTAAAAEVRKWTPNYDDSGPAVKVLRESVFGSPFATYHFETARIIGTAIKEHPLRLAHALAFLKALQFTLDQMGSSGTVTEKERRAIETIRGSQEVITRRDAEGKPQTFNYRYINPLGSWDKPPTRLGDEGTADVEYLLGLLGLSESPVLDVGATLIRKEDRYGRPIMPTAPTSPEAIKGWLMAYARLTAPGLTPGVGAQSDQLEAAFEDRQLSERIPKQTVVQAIVSSLLGVDERQFDTATEKKFLTRRMEGIESGVRRDVKKAVKDDPEDAQDYRDSGRTKVRSLAEEFKRRRSILSEAEPVK